MYKYCCRSTFYYINFLKTAPFPLGYLIITYKSSLDVVKLFPVVKEVLKIPYYTLMHLQLIYISNGNF